MVTKVSKKMKVGKRQVTVSTRSPVLHCTKTAAIQKHR